MACEISEKRNIVFTVSISISISISISKILSL